jgi:hypothetical protein
VSRGLRLLCLGLIASAWLAPGALQAGWVRYAVVAGNNRGLAREDALRFAEADARRVAEVLRGPGGFSPEHTVTLAGQSKAAFVEAVRGLAPELEARAQAGDQTLLVLYFSGHSDGTHLQFGDDLLAFSSVRRLLSSAPATLKVLIVDSCQSGGLTGIKGVVPLADVDVWLRGAGAARGTVIVTASSLGEVAQESAELGGSFFTHHLVWGLRGAADYDQDQRVTLGEAYQYAYSATVDGTWHTVAGRQHPTIELELDQRGEVPLTDLATKDAAIRFGADIEGAWALLDPEGAGILAEVRKPRGHVQRLAVASGSYWVAQRRGERIWVQLVTATPGAEVAVDPRAMLDQTAVIETARKSGNGQRRGHLQAIAGYGLSSGTLGKTSAMHHGLAGVRWDLGRFSLMPRLVYGETRGWGDLPTQNTRRFVVRGLGLETTLALRFEVSLLDLFAGVNLGAWWLHQRFQAAAPLPDESHDGLAALLGLLVGLDVPLGAGWSAQVSWEVDEWLYPQVGMPDPVTSVSVRGALGVGYRF